MVDLKEFHDVLLEILIEFDRICRKYDIKYSLAWGTLLGAVRHQGFIPWDDDVDIIMPRKDYEKFLKLSSQELNNNYFLQSINTETAYQYNITRIRKNNTAMIYSNWKNAGFHQGIYMDISPIDHIPDDEKLFAKQKRKIIFLTPIRAARNKDVFFNCGLNLNKFVKSILYVVLNCFPRKYCQRKEYEAITKYNDSRTKRVGLISEGGVLLNTPADLRPFDSKVLDEFVDIEFEGRQFLATKYYDEMLKFWYGDYMQLPPKEQQVMFHQPEIFSTNRSYKEFL
ncbi:LicD family protein [Paludicola sp. MB14-C6]|uniref:LicD family protein n=1 Tax=Paludihabitans sp. MB14-C6 TaxID=3070656 RepID=UPI0027DB4BDF|nr:LicD family protein [Paludicola sp. MB14-C6]WMJ22937.1 LicD family protein [Paludicola sp. MB14-C6]